MTQTTPYGLSYGPSFQVVLPLTLALSVGTGGNYSDIYLNSRPSSTPSLPFARLKDGDVVSFAKATAVAEDIDFVKSVLKLSIREVAVGLGVSRQAIYDWKAGAEIKAANAAKLQQMRDAAEVIVAADLPPTPQFFRRQLPSGQTLLDAIASGRSGKEAAATLVSMLREETERRAKLSARFANRRPMPIDDASLVFDEKG
jgi:hypothetical protein